MGLRAGWEGPWRRIALSTNIGQFLSSISGVPMRGEPPRGWLCGGGHSAISGKLRGGDRDGGDGRAALPEPEDPAKSSFLCSSSGPVSRCGPFLGTPSERIPEPLPGGQPDRTQCTEPTLCPVLLLCSQANCLTSLVPSILISNMGETLPREKARTSVTWGGNGMF